MESFITSLLFAIHAITADGNQQLLQQASRLPSLNNPSYQTVMECVPANSDPTQGFKIIKQSETANSKTVNNINPTIRSLLCSSYHDLS